jgi:hypothetical protein
MRIGFVAYGIYNLGTTRSFMCFALMQRLKAFHMVLGLLLSQKNHSIKNPGI